MSTTTYNLTDFPELVNMLGDTDDSVTQDTQEATVREDSVNRENYVPRSDSDNPNREIVRTDVENDDLKLSADQTSRTDYETPAVGAPTENERVEKNKDPFRRRSNPTENQPCMARQSSGRNNNNQLERYTTGRSGNDLQISRRLEAIRISRRLGGIREANELHSNKRRAESWKLAALAIAALLVSALLNLGVFRYLGFCLCPMIADSAASDAALLRLHFHHQDRSPGTVPAVSLRQTIGSVFLSYTALPWLLLIIVAVAAILFLARKWRRRNT